MNNQALELIKRSRMQVRLQRKLRELERMDDKQPLGRRTHLELQVQELHIRLNGKINGG